MSVRYLVAALVATSVLASACGGGATSQPVSQASGSSSQSAAASPFGSGSAPTAAPGARAASTTPAKASSSSAAGTGAPEKVGLPVGTAFDPYKPLKIGDVVDLTKSKLVLQVTGAKTVDYDAQRDFLLVDLVLGNKNSEKLPVSSVLMMSAVTSDWREYRLTLDELFTAAAKIATLNVRSFDTELLPNEAKKGTAVIPIPKNATGLAFALHPAGTDPLGENDPTVYVSLGLNGDFAFPIIPADVQPFKAGTVYKVGQAVKAPRRGVAIQINAVRERTDSVPKYTMNVANKVVLVDITTRAFANQDLLGKELSLVDSNGKYFRDMAGGGDMSGAKAIIDAESGIDYSSRSRRGLIAFLGPRDGKGLKLTYKPSDDEKVDIDLGTPTPVTSTASATTVQAPSTGNKGGTTAGLKLADASVLPAELKPIPLPPGFGVVDGSSHRSAPGGAFESAEASLFGKMSIKELNAFYKSQLAGSWDENDIDVGTGYLQNNYISKNGSQILYIDAEETDKGTTVDLRVDG